MIRKKKGNGFYVALFLCMALICWAFPADAQAIGNWDGDFINGSPPEYFDFPMTVSQDGLVTLVTTCDNTFLSVNFNYLDVRDQNLNRIGSYDIIDVSPSTYAIPLAAENYTVRIGRTNDVYGHFNIQATLSVANAGATETENNDVIGAASTNVNNLFAGAIGHWRMKDVKDLSDYYRLTLSGDTNVHFAITCSDSLTSFSTSLSVKSASDVTMSYTYLSATSLTWDLHLAAGTYYLRLYTADYSKYGGYTITTTATAAVSPSSETENNDTLAAANAIKSTQILGSIGYYRDKSAGGTEYWDNSDYFSCQVSQDGTLSIEMLFPSTLDSFNNAVSIRDSSNTTFDFAYVTGSPKTVTVNNLDAGTYYIRVYRATGYGAYQINVSGDVVIPAPKKGNLGAILPLLICD